MSAMGMCDCAAAHSRTRARDSHGGPCGYYVGDAMSAMKGSVVYTQRNRGKCTCGNCTWQSYAATVRGTYARQSPSIINRRVLSIAEYYQLPRVRGAVIVRLAMHQALR